MGGIQTEPEVEFLPASPIADVHQAELAAVIASTEKLAECLKKSKTYQEVRDAMHQGEISFEAIPQDGLQEIIGQLEPTIPDTIPAGKEGEE